LVDVLPLDERVEEGEGIGGLGGEAVRGCLVEGEMDDLGGGGEPKEAR
jgi:hypothetical protein